MRAIADCHTLLSLEQYEQHCQSLGDVSSRVSELHTALLRAWQEPQRGYHTLQHLGECLELAESRRPFLSTQQFALLVQGLWFHDAVYDPKASDNERQSATWAEEALSALGLAADSVAQVRRLILATDHLSGAVPEADPLVDLLLDIDLAILGATPARFDEYSQQVKFEYSWVPDEVYALKRRQVLQHFLRQAEERVLFRTSWARDLFTSAAVLNLRRALGR